MAINQFFQETQTNVPSRVDIHARGTGAGASSLTSVKGVTSIVWVSTGKYTVNLPRKFAGLVGIRGTVINSAGTTLSLVFPSADAVASAGTITIEVFGGLTTVAPTRRDLTSADILLLEINLMDSAQKPARF
jgi:hypothetical protein